MLCHGVLYVLVASLVYWCMDVHVSVVVVLSYGGGWWYGCVVFICDDIHVVVLVV